MKRISSIVAALLLFSISTFAETITFRADRMTGSTKKSGDITTLQGNAII